MPGNDLWPLIGSRMAASESSVRTDEHVNPVTRGLLAVMQAVILALAIAGVLAAIVGFVYSLTIMRGKVWLAVGLLFLCFGAIVALLLLIQNMVNELGGHYWRQSPFEKAIAPVLVELLHAMAHEHDSAEVPRIIPYSVGGETHATSAAHVHPVPIAREDARMLDFLTIALTRHIDAPTRRKMRADDGQEHYALSQCKEPLNREAYEAIMLDLVQWGFAAVPKGTGAVWVVPPAEAYAVLAAEVERRRRG